MLPNPKKPIFSPSSKVRFLFLSLSSNGKSHHICNQSNKRSGNRWLVHDWMAEWSRWGYDLGSNVSYELLTVGQRVCFIDVPSKWTFTALSLWQVHPLLGKKINIVYNTPGVPSTRDEPIVIRCPWAMVQSYYNSSLTICLPNHLFPCIFTLNEFCTCTPRPLWASKAPINFRKTLPSDVYNYPYLRPEYWFQTGLFTSCTLIAIITSRVYLATRSFVNPPSLTWSILK